uniref:Uncharacterized protein n=1 Tax=Anguilla anguilla TaxID=7936 RepID=A0A0E9WGT7_ANGAN
MEAIFSDCNGVWSTVDKFRSGSLNNEKKSRHTQWQYNYKQLYMKTLLNLD